MSPVLIFALYIAAVAWFRRAPSPDRLAADSQAFPRSNPPAGHAEIVGLCIEAHRASDFENLFSHLPADAFTLLLRRRAG